MSSSPNTSESIRPTNPIAFHAVTLATFFGASSAPTPLYRFYQENFAASPVEMTVIFAVYAFALLAALLIAGSVSDHLGRKPVIFGALIIEMAAMALFFLADGTGWLIAARIVQGLATGVAGASLGAALVDVDHARGQLVNSLAPLIGLAVGALGTSALIQYGPLPLHLVYGLLFAGFLIQAAAIWLIPETGARRHGALSSLIPRVAIPPRAKRPLALVTPVNIANWALGGFYLSLVPAMIASTTGNTAPLTGGAVVAALMAAGAAGVYLRRARRPQANLTFGVLSTTAGMLTVVTGIHLTLVPVLALGTLLTGMGFGTSFLATLGSVMPLAKADERAGLLSAIYIQSYLAFSLPAILAGFLAKALGYQFTTDIYAAAIIGVSLLGLAANRTASEREPSIA
ncbi:MFS transporter [Ensifer sp. MJa1]|uniref:MFS transporter n=1 Tax=Ensifer sp. MJa1 TaxID=2919888 RepID=UPI003007FED6